jgi:hypothetical protein
MAKQLFTVTVEHEIIVVADSADKAEDLAREADIDEEPDFHATPLRYLPAEWEGDSIPYGDRDETEPDRTVKQWIDAGAAPQYNITPKAKT